MPPSAASRPLPPAPAKPLNVLVLYADDLRFATLGAAGNPIVKTPNLDRLAGRGIHFTSACVTTSICGVSRASLFTGQCMSRHGNPAMKEFKTPWQETYPGLLRSHGYFTGHIGKWHNGRFPAENFVILFAGDNGYFHGEHGLAGKWYPHQESIRVPLIVHDPRLPEEKRGATNDDFVLNVDFAPTILAAAGIKAPSSMQGRDIAPLYLAAAKPEWRDEFFYEHASSGIKLPASEALVRKDWKYFHWPDAKQERLFHIAEDPFEENDLAADPAHADRLAGMRARFAELKAAAK